MVSIVLPVYNGEHYLAESIESCLNQTFNDLELIIVNDASTDDSLAIAEKYAEKDSRVRIISNATNKRLPESLNIGFAASKGEFLTWTSDDNYFQENAIEAMRNYLILYKDISLVYADCYFINEFNKITGFCRDKGRSGCPNELPIYNTVFACFMYRRDLYNKTGRYSGEWETIEDYEFFLRAYFAYNFTHIPQGLYYYRRHSKSLTSTQPGRQYRGVIKLHRYIIDHYGEKIKDEIKIRMHIEDVTLAILLNDRESAMESYRLSCKISTDAKYYYDSEQLKFIGLFNYIGV